MVSVLKEDPMTKWGIIGAGNIAKRFAASLEKIEGSELYAISGRKPDKLKEFAAQYPCSKQYLNYDSLLADENVDAVYVSLPHGIHAEWVKKSLTAGKAVLECGFDRRVPSRAVIEGTDGTIIVEPMHRPDCYTLIRDEIEQKEYLPFESDDFSEEIRHFEGLLQDRRIESSIMSFKDTLRCAHISDQIRASFSEYDRNDLAVLRQQEDIFRMDAFTSADALRTGNAVVKLLDDYDRGISCTIIREADEAVIFQYIHDDKAERNIGFARGKRKAMLKYGHSSAWVYAAVKAGVLEPDQSVIAGGGAFPIFSHDGTLLASILESGLHEGKDHELILRALRKAFRRLSATCPPCTGTRWISCSRLSTL